jgi:flagellar hook protein FlgE
MQFADPETVDLFERLLPSIGRGDHMLSVSMAGLNAAKKDMDVISNNMANANTVGFKRSVSNFGDVFSSDPASNPKTAVGAGVLTSSIDRDTTAGSLKTTGRVTDLAIDGRGYFVVKDPSGGSNKFTRAGNFNLDSQGYIVDNSGNQLMGFSGSSNSAISALQVPSKFSSGQTLPDGSVVGAASQTISFNGAATDSGTITIGGVSIAIVKGDSISQIASKVQAALASSPSFSGRQVSIVGSGDKSKVQVVFGAGETVSQPLSIDYPSAASPATVSMIAGKITQPEIQAFTDLTGGISQTINWIKIDDHVNPPFQINFPTPLTGPQAGDYMLNDFQTNPSRYAAFLVGRSVDPSQFVARTGPILLTFNQTVNNPLITVTNSAGGTVDLTRVQNAILDQNSEKLNFADATSSGDLSLVTSSGSSDIPVPGAATVSITAGDSAQTIANKVAQELQKAYPTRTITVSNNQVLMTYAAIETSTPLVKAVLSPKKPVTASTTFNATDETASDLLQSLSISPKGEVVGTYSNGGSYTIGMIAIASFANDAGLKDIGGNNFVQTGISGNPSILQAGAPKSGNIMTGMLEQSNVDLTTELMSMIRAQQVYNGNARIIQTTMDTFNKISDLR